MSAKKKAVPASSGGGVDASNEQILNAAMGYARLLKIGFPSVFSMELQKRYQGMMFVAKPLNDEDARLRDRFTKKDKKGNPIAGAPLEDGRQTVVLTNGTLYAKEVAALMAQRQRVKVAKLERSKIPARVQQPTTGKLVDVVIEGEVWELLGPFLTD